MLRKCLSLALVAACLSMLVPVRGAVAAERMAMGLIVKLKDAQPQSVVKLKALAVPRDTPQKQAMRLSAAALRTRVSYLIQRPTTFGAMVTHNGRATTLAQAQADAERLRKDPDVEWVVVNELEQPMALSTNDPYVGYQNWMEDPTAVLSSPNIPAAFDRIANSGRTLHDVVVAVLDTGILPHPDLAGRVLSGHDFVTDLDTSRDGDGIDADPSDPGDYVTAGESAGSNPALKGCEARASEWHGLAIAGVLAAGMDNGIGMVGMLGPLGPSVLPVRVAGPCGAAVSDILEGMFWAAGISYNGSTAAPANLHPARVINLSFGGRPGCACSNPSSFNGSEGGACLYRQAVQALTSKGALLVAAAGNDRANEASRPASCPGVLAVTALRSNGRRASYANLALVPNADPDPPHFAMATIGGEWRATDTISFLQDLDSTIFTLSNKGRSGPVAYGLNDPLQDDYTEATGTSLATPIVSGALALMLAVNPDLSVSELLGGLMSAGHRAHVTSGSCSPSTSGCECTTTTCGPGILDVDLAVQWALTHTAAVAYSPSTVVNASFFVPERLSRSNSRSSGGGGSLDLATVLALGAVLMGGLWQRWHPQARG